MTNTAQYVTLALPINRGKFNELLEYHIREVVIPTAYVGSRVPTDDDLWIMVHEWPLAEQDETFAAISYPRLSFDTLMAEAIVPVLSQRFGLQSRDLPLCFERWSNCVRAYVQHRFNTCPESIDLPITVTC